MKNSVRQMTEILIMLVITLAVVYPAYANCSRHIAPIFAFNDQ
jgi:hypothetical protein